MNKQKLLAMGVTEEQATQIMNELNGNFIPKSRFDEVNELKKSYQEQLKQRDTQLEELKKNVGDSEQLKKQIETLQNVCSVYNIAVWHPHSSSDLAFARPPSPRGKGFIPAT